MEGSVKSVGDNSVTKSTGSLVAISSIYIDLKIPVEKNEIKSCEHNFSIRGYAAKMRIKNPKSARPFATDGNLHDIEEQLPPLHVPKFRWWKCPECRSKIDNTTESMEEEINKKDGDWLNATPIEPLHSEEDSKRERANRPHFEERELTDARRQKISCQKNHEKSSAILGEEEVLRESPNQQQAKPSSSLRRSLPSKFRFQYDEPKVPQKSEYKKMVEALFTELENCWTYESMDTSE